MAYFGHIDIDHLTPDQKYYESFLIKLKSGTYGGSKICMAAAAKRFGEKLQGMLQQFETKLINSYSLRNWSDSQRRSSNVR